MEIDDRFAPVELVEDRRIGGIARPGLAVAGQQADAVELQHVERIFDLAQAALDIG